jgi:hypothetical protein
LWHGETDSLVPKETTMSHIATSPHGRTSKIARLTASMRKTWTDARLTDRRLMEMRTNLSRHSG